MYQLFQYVDLDEFLSENGVSMDGLGSHGSMGPLGSSHGVPKRERSPSPSDCMSPDTMNPPSPADSSKYNCFRCQYQSLPIFSSQFKIWPRCNKTKMQLELKYSKCEINTKLRKQKTYCIQVADLKITH